MPRKKAKPTIKDQLRAIIAQALEEGQLDLAKSLIEVIRAMGGEIESDGKYEKGRNGNALA